MMRQLFPGPCTLFAIGVLSLTALPAQAVFIGNTQGGTDFPAGAASFADAVVSYSPAGPPSIPHQGAFNALGVPDYAGGSSCSSQADCSFVSLGSGGVLVLRFTDNRLTGSGNNDLDLWIFEVGPNVEDTFVDISMDGSIWHSVGSVGGSLSGIDIDAYGWGIGDEFAFVRLTDDPNEGGGGSGGTVGADIDAVGAISTVLRTVPAPATWLLVLGGLGVMMVRRRTTQAGCAVRA